MGIDDGIQQGSVIGEIFFAAEEKSVNQEAANFLLNIGCSHDSESFSAVFFSVPE
jgi:hypothetical protein